MNAIYNIHRKFP